MTSKPRTPPDPATEQRAALDMLNRHSVFDPEDGNYRIEAGTWFTIRAALATTPDPATGLGERIARVQRAVAALMDRLDYVNGADAGEVVREVNEAVAALSEQSDGR